jgi:hypothetical protein
LPPLSSSAGAFKTRLKSKEFTFFITHTVNCTLPLKEFLELRPNVRRTGTISILYEHALPESSSSSFLPAPQMAQAFTARLGRVLRPYFYGGWVTLVACPHLPRQGACHVAFHRVSLPTSES